jgi:hypothetical protein
MEANAIQVVSSIYLAATPVIKIRGLGGQRWKRNVAKGGRIGPWLQATYEVMNPAAWAQRGVCLYLVSGSDAKVRYVGISRNGLKHRWRTSPAYDAVTMQRLPQNQLFHSQCWKHIEAETNANPRASFEVRSITDKALLVVLGVIGPPLSAFSVLSDDGESVVAAVERWICNHSSPELVCWNSAMAGGAKV